MNFFFISRFFLIVIAGSRSIARSLRIFRYENATILVVAILRCDSIPSCRTLGEKFHWPVRKSLERLKVNGRSIHGARTRFIVTMNISRNISSTKTINFNRAIIVDRNERNIVTLLVKDHAINRFHERFHESLLEKGR